MARQARSYTANKVSQREIVKGRCLAPGALGDHAQ
jgi:hypothetical protein